MTDNQTWAAGIAVPAATPYTPPEQPAAVADPNARPRRILGVVVAATVAAGAALVGLTTMLRDGEEPAPLGGDPTSAAVPVLPPPVAAADPEPIPYTATDRCPAGSTGPTPLAGSGWWVCVRGAAGAGLDGQIIRIAFGEPQVITSVEIVPGAAPDTRGGKDEWRQHRVVRMLQYNFCNGGVCVPVVQDTSDGKGGPVPAGPVAKRLERPLLAASVDVTIQRTDRPATEPAATSELPPTDAPDISPVDYTVAVGDLRFFGHPATEPG